MRFIFVAVLFAVLATAANAQQAATWDEWLASARSLIPVKEEGARTFADYRDHVCPLQTEAKKRHDCAVKFEELRVRREKEKTLISGMIHALKLPDGEGLALIEIVNPVVRQMDKETTAMTVKALQEYPRKRANTK